MVRLTLREDYERGKPITLGLYDDKENTGVHSIGRVHFTLMDICDCIDTYGILPVLSCLSVS